MPDQDALISSVTVEEDDRRVGPWPVGNIHQAVEFAARANERKFAQLRRVGKIHNVEIVGRWIGFYLW